MSSQFVQNTRIGVQVMGLYGITRLRKTTLFKAFCDYFYGEFLGKVCHVELEKLSRAKRQKLILKTLCGFEKDVLDRIGDEDKGMMQMEVYMEREPVFLVIDNVTNDKLIKARDYLIVGFHPKSRIMLTSRSKAILEDLLPDMESFVAMPKLRDEEAVLFLKHAAPLKCISVLTGEERRILQIRVGRSYHPLALSALADFLSRVSRAKDSGILLWKDHLGKNVVPLKDVWKSSNDLFGILGLQFSTFNLKEKLLFLDIALFADENDVFWSMYTEDLVEWLCELHEETPTIVRKIVRKMFHNVLVFSTGSKSFENVM